MHPEVGAALSAGRPVVALESSVLAQGLPAPSNREAARRMRAAIEACAAVPAVTAVVRGAPTIGLDGGDLERFLTPGAVHKVSARDLPWAMASASDGATTVAAALVLAARAGLRVLATGGIGGVHRDTPFDESADLLELSRVPVVVVCSGAKAILDLPATLERLETLGVAVIGYRTDVFPGFYAARTGLPLHAVAHAPSEIAAAYRAAQALGRPGALLVVQAPPAESALDATVVEAAVAGAMRAAAGAGVRGSALTPFLLSAVDAATAGRARAANLALLESNAGLAAEVAVALGE